MTYQNLSVDVDVRDGVSHLTLGRPDAANALNLALAQELADAARRLHDDERVRAVLLSGTGKMFCGGGDVKAFAAEEDLGGALRELSSYLHLAVSRLVRLPVPVVAAVQGSAAGAGLALAAAADLVVAGESARFVVAYTGIGLTLDGASTYFLPRLVGQRRALELALTNRVLSANDAAEWGIVSHVVPDGELQHAAEELTSELATGPTQSFGATKRLLRESWTESLETQMESESQALSEAGSRRDAAEGVAAFVEKRPPHFTGE